MNRFFVNKANIVDGMALITGEDAVHAARVLRMRAGDPLVVCDGACTEYGGTIECVESGAVRVSLGPGRRCLNEPPYETTLLQGLPKGDKMDAIVQKCVELGVYAIQPIAAQRSVVRLRPGEFEKKRVRYQRIADEAAKQCGRGRLPRVADLSAFADVDFSVYDLILIPYEEEETCTLKDVLRGTHPRRVAVAVGPEGGMEAEEVAHMRAQGGRVATLGKRILRTETAGMAVLAMLQYEWEL